MIAFLFNFLWNDSCLIIICDEGFIKELSLLLINSDIFKLTSTFFLSDWSAISEGVNILEHLWTIDESMLVIVKQVWFVFIKLFRFFKLVKKIWLGLIKVNECWWIAILKLIISHFLWLCSFSHLNFEDHSFEIFKFFTLNLENFQNFYLWLLAHFLLLLSLLI